MSFYDVMNSIDSFLWGTPFLAFVILVGLYFTIRGGLFTIAHFGHVIKFTEVHAGQHDQQRGKRQERQARVSF